ncbi:hypothetical protein [Roseospirillum parvum]|uniref:Cysteine rich repeat-containing protein n=1 Tax=Roseospirillum parvum TaxID=83401 RepID=A0A1G8CWM3_9PROT|nr:hypothetical protein [Roseospirillum parvum]SDH49901.1 hypothetical protein SAMN05421742_107120 [Roseospirillum parvum]
MSTLSRPGRLTLCLVLVLPLLVPLARPAAGESGQSPAQGTEQAIQQCKSEHAGCLNACAYLNGDDEARQTGCEARCAADRAACEALAGYAKVKPWLDQQKESVDRLLDGLSRDGDGEPVTGQRCDERRQGCQGDCADRFPEEDDEGRLSCTAVCEAEHAACQTLAGVEKARPWIRQQTEKLRDFLDGFMGTPPKDRPEPKPAEPANKSAPETLDI